MIMSGEGPIGNKRHPQTRVVVLYPSQHMMIVQEKGGNEERSNS